MTIQEELVEMTQCKLHGVNSTLRIYLEGKTNGGKIFLSKYEFVYTYELGARLEPIISDKHTHYFENDLKFIFFVIS